MYRFAKRYVDRYNNDNNADMKANGEVRFLQLYLPRCETVFDIGANVGDWTALALKFNPVAAIHCFEPSGSTFELLRSRGFPANVALNNIGLSSSRREAELFVSSNNSGMNSLYARDGLEGFEVACQVRQHIVLDTVDNYCRERRIQSIDLVKMDVEGHEMEICKGMSQMLGSGRIGAIQFEYGGCNIDARTLLKDIFAFFKQHHYLFYKIYPKRLKFVPHYDQRLENFQYQNWVVLKNRDVSI